MWFAEKIISFIKEIWIEFWTNEEDKISTIVVKVLIVCFVVALLKTLLWWLSK